MDSTLCVDIHVLGYEHLPLLYLIYWMTNHVVNVRPSSNYCLTFCELFFKSSATLKMELGFLLNIQESRNASSRASDYMRNYIKLIIAKHKDYKVNVAMQFEEYQHDFLLHVDKALSSSTSGKTENQPLHLYDILIQQSPMLRLILWEVFGHLLQTKLHKSAQTFEVFCFGEYQLPVLNVYEKLLSPQQALRKDTTFRKLNKGMNNTYLDALDAFDAFVNRIDSYLNLSHTESQQKTTNTEIMTGTYNSHKKE